MTKQSIGSRKQELQDQYGSAKCGDPSWGTDTFALALNHLISEVKIEASENSPTLNPFPGSYDRDRMVRNIKSAAFDSLCQRLEECGGDPEYEEANSLRILSHFRGYIRGINKSIEVV